MMTRRAFLLGLTAAMLLAGCASTTPRTSQAARRASSTTSSDTGAASSSCPKTGCPVPDCRGGVVQHMSIGHAADAVGVKDVEADLARWVQALVGQGETFGLPTQPTRIAFLVRRSGKDLAVLSYVTDDHEGWLRSGYAGCGSALRP